MRNLRALLLLYTSFFVVIFGIGACASDGGGAPSSLATTEPPTQSYAFAAPNQPTTTPPASIARIEVKGALSTDLDNPAGARLVVLVDATGEQREVLTDDSGAFDIPNVLVPYDVLVTSSDEAVKPATIYLGLDRPDPFIELVERDGPPLVAPPQTLHVTLEEGCHGGQEVRVLSWSPHGQGVADFSCADENAPVSFDVTHTWNAIWIDPSERIDVELLVADEEQLAFSTAHASGIVTTPNVTTSVSVSVAAIAAAPPLLVDCYGLHDSLADWQWSTALSLSPPSNRALLPYTTLAGVGAATVLPRIDGWNLHATLTAQHSAATALGDLHQSIKAWSGGRAISGQAISPIDLAMSLSPDMEAPTIALGLLSRRGHGFAWSMASGENALSTLTVADTKRSRVRFRAITAGHELPFLRLHALGVDRLDLGAHELRLTTQSNTPIDDVVSPDVQTRTRSRDHTQAGWQTDLVEPFVVTP